MAWDFNDLVWTTTNLEDGNRIAYAGPSHAAACRVAAALVGNNSASDQGEIVLYGRGDGTASVMVRQLPRGCTLPADPMGLRIACEAVANSMSQGEDGFWRAGPWADPATEDGQGGTVELIRKALSA